LVCAHLTYHGRHGEMFVNRFVRLLPKSRLKKALAYFNKGDYRKACREFEYFQPEVASGTAGQDHEMVRMYMVESYIEYAKILSADGKYREASLELEKATGLQPGYADVQYSLGWLYEKLGRNDEARERFEKALDINPKYFRARVMLAKNCLYEGRKEETLAELDLCLSASPTFFMEQVTELIELVKSDSPAEEMEKILHSLLAERPSSSQVAKQIALEAIQNGDHELATRELKRSLSMNPNYPDLHNLLGIAYANMGLIDDALLEFETALKIHPDYLKARLNMALTLYEKGSTEEAMLHLEKVLKLDQDNELAQNLLKELQPVPR
jgi:tetratricopeptide (TPR) repeat protein